MCSKWNRRSYLDCIPDTKQRRRYSIDPALQRLSSRMKETLCEQKHLHTTTTTTIPTTLI